MGRKGKQRKAEDEDDYIASLTVSSADSVTTKQPEVDEDALEEAAMKRAEKAEAAKAKAAEEKLVKALNAERARAMMDKRAKPKRGKAAAAREEQDYEEEEEEELPAPVAKSTSKATADEEEDDDDDDDVVDYGLDDEDEVVQEEAAPVATPGEALSVFGKVLVLLRPWSPEAATKGGPMAVVLCWLWQLFSAFASADLLRQVDTDLSENNSEVSDKIAAEHSRKNSEELWNGRKWFPRNFGVEQYQGTTLRLSEDGEALERWQKNVNTRSKKEIWMKVREGEGWASAPKSTGRADEDVPVGDVVFFALLDDRAFECTSFVESSVLTASQARDLCLIDSGRAVFELTTDSEGRVGANLLQKHAESLARGAVGEAAPGPKGQPAKEKKSRADKKLKKMSYGR